MSLGRFTMSSDKIQCRCIGTQLSKSETTYDIVSYDGNRFIMTKNELLRYIKSGKIAVENVRVDSLDRVYIADKKGYNTVNVVCFHSPGEENDYLSNWYYSEFTVNGITFNSVEQYMMYHKAVQFGDTVTAREIMKTKSFGRMKELGRMVRNYDDHVWSAVRYDVVKQGVLLKFSQNKDLAKRLLSTGNSLLAECAVHDTIWGIGMSMHNKNKTNPDMWKGQNLLGRALMEVRDMLRNSQ